MSPVEYPDNPWTRLIERAAALNASGEYRGGGGAASADPRPTVSSAAMGRETVVEPELTMEERAALDQKAVELGIMSPEDATFIPEFTQQEDPLAAHLAARKVGTSIATQRIVHEFTASARFPDFTRVESIDLVRGVVILDGMDFPIHQEEVISLKQYVVDTAKKVVLQKLADATQFFAKEATSGRREDVQPVPESESSSGIQSGPVS